MQDSSFTLSIELKQSSETVFGHIIRVPEWWTKDFEGSCARLFDEFVICHPGQHYSKQRVIELIPGEKIVWQFIDSELNWLENKAEWTDTKMIFEISKHGNNTLLQFTHEGLIPTKQCYERVAHGWSIVITQGLYNYITQPTTA